MAGEGLALLGLKFPSQAVLVTALGEAARSPGALAAYGFLALSWALLLGSGQSMRGFASAIAELSELQRAQILKRAYPAFERAGLSSHAFIARRQRRTWLLAFAALLVLVTVIAVATTQAIDWRAVRYS